MNNDFFNVHSIDLLIRHFRRITKDTSRTNTSSHEGGTQTLIRPSGEGGSHDIRHTQGGGEVRVIVQPIQPVFYMPRQSKINEKQSYNLSTFSHRIQ